ncbi:MAG: LL-diaminopimelate aminotransferase [Oscillospiraceae bacterium]|jgi:LL-diaminopimelate aminotransferase|nr:LL-diaminopimelate aminotransferase [Oscillospiraceae bacterium]
MIQTSVLEIPASYLFSDIGKQVAAYQASHPDKRVIRMGIGDVTRPLPRVCIDALHKATDEMASADTLRGYGPDQGYEFLRDAIARNEYQSRGATIYPDEIFVSDGAKSDSANIQELFDVDSIVGVTDPVYPVYVDSNAMAGRLGHYLNGDWTRLVTFPCTEENGFVASPPRKEVSLIYLCFPNNPTGATASASQLKAWVDYALDHRAVILYDAAYRAYITNPDIPRSIYEIEGARECAIEFGSFSKTAGFTGLRCSWTVVPKDLRIDNASLHALWARRQATKFNGTPYIVQRAAEAIYTEEGKAQVERVIGYYMENAARIRGALEALGLTASGGVNAPYVWLKCPDDQSSWAFFDRLLNEAQVIGTPGSGFGACGEGYFRLTAFGSHEDTIEAMDRLRKIL